MSRIFVLEVDAGGLVYCSGEMSVTEYDVVFPVESNAGGVLTYYDYASETKYPFCGNANCEHKDDSCDAWFDSAVSGATIYGVDFANKTLNVVYQSENQLSIQCAADGNIFFLQLDDAREEMLANSYLNIETSEVTDLNGRISGGGWIFGANENFFVGNGRNGSICILKEDYYASAFKKAVVMDKE